jgi:glucose/arabinose dehydrogenase
VFVAAVAAILTLAHKPSKPAAAPGGGGSRIVFGRDGMVYMNVSAGGDPPAPASMTAQDPGSLQGKVLRLRDDGTIPPTTPSSIDPARNPKSSPSAIATSSVWTSIPSPARFGRARTAPTAATK